MRYDYMHFLVLNLDPISIDGTDEFEDMKVLLKLYNVLLYTEI